MQQCLLVALLFLSLFAAAQASTFKDRQPKYKINSNDTVVSPVEKASTALFQNGNRIVVWLSDPSYFVVGRIVDNNGKPISEVFNISQNALTKAVATNVVTVTYGNTALVVWDDTFSPEAQNIHASFVDSQGRKEKEFMLPLGSGSVVLNPTIASLGNGLVFVSWVLNPPYSDLSICSMVMSFDGSFSNQTCLPTTQKLYISFKVKVLGDGQSVALLWEEYLGPLKAVIVSPNGDRLSPEVTIRPRAAYGGSNLALIGDDILIVWQSSVASDPEKIHVEGCVMDVKGNIITPNFTISHSDKAAFYPSAIALGDNRGFVMWKNCKDVLGTFESCAFGGRVVDRHGALLTDVLEVIPKNDPTQAAVVATLIGGDPFLLRLDQSDAPNPSRGNLFGQTFHLSTNSHSHSIAIN